MDRFITIRDEDPATPEAGRLMDELSGTLEAITGSSGRGSFEVVDICGGRAVFAVARDQDGKAVGCGAIRPDGDNTAEVKRMYAGEKGKGIGKKVLSYLEMRAWELGYRALKLETRLINRRAVAFYEKNGYTRIPNYGKYAGRPEAVCFEKQLSAELKEKCDNSGENKKQQGSISK